GVLVADSLTGSIAKTSLTEAERKAPLALAPLTEWLASQKGKHAQGFEDLVAGVREEAWGMGSGPLARQNAVLGYLHDTGEGKDPELWVKVEFQPWWKGFSNLPDEDDDGVPEIYGRARDGLIKAETVALIKSDYAGKVLDAAGVASWAHKLASYWYPSYNTDLVPGAETWPDKETEADVREALGDKTYKTPTVVMRGKPEGKAVYNVFLVKGMGAAGHAAGGGSGAKKLSKNKPTPQTANVAKAIQAELKGEGGGSWRAWEEKVGGYHADLRKRLRSSPPAIKGFSGEDGYLFYRNGFDYIVGGDLDKQKKGKNPLPVIVEWKKLLEKQGVDFLFVPVPDKAEIFPDKVVGTRKNLVGKVVNPYARKLLADLAAAGVETVDLWRPFLDDRKREPEAEEPIFQKQDTHWTPRGMAIAAQAISERIKQYPWASELTASAKAFTEKDAPFKRYGDLHSRLRDAEKKKYKPEELVGHQVVGPDGQLYVDDPDSTVVILGDSFTGVLGLTDCEHAGVSAHIAKHIGNPVDLVMSYGGGPNVRHKLMRRGVEGLAGKRLVVWIMTARDLYNYWESWEPLRAAKS
ncbi:MAG TPA: hypothetical protein VGG33_11810, partial [Polyangia bacterium]